MRGALWAYSINHDEGTCVVAIAGQVDAAVREEFAAVLLDEVNRPDTVAVQVDLHRVEFLDSSGIAALVQAREAANNLGRRFTLVRVHGSALKVLTITGLMPLLAE